MAGRTKLSLWLLAGGLLLAGCGGSDDAGEPAAGLPYQEVLSSAFSGVTEVRQVVVNDDAAWAHLWTQHTSNVFPAPPRPGIDFTSHTVAAVFLGRSVTCQRPVIAAVALTPDDAIQVSWRLAGPAAGEFCATVVTTPVQMISIANAARRPVRFALLTGS